MKLSLKQVVNVYILSAFIGMFISFPFKDHLIGGILFAACSAATIGGLADSFAVSALFGQPLRVPWPKWMGTNIISRNRERLINELVNMVEQELLSTEMIRKQLKQYNATEMLMSYANSAEGKRAIKELASQAIGDVLRVSHPSVISLSLKRLVNQGLEGISLTELLAKLLQFMHQHQYDESIVRYFAKQCRTFIEQDNVKKFIHEFIATALRSYENNSKRRQFVNGVAGLNAEDVTTKLLNIAKENLSAMEQGEHEWNKKLPQLLLNNVQSWSEDGQLHHRWNERLRKAAMMISSFVLGEHNVKRAMEAMIAQLEGLDDTEQRNVLSNWLDEQLEQAFAVSSNNPAFLSKTNEFIVAALIGFVERNHNYIGRLVRDKLEQFDEKQLIALVQEKAGKDLQYIRLNGTLIGALIGILLFLIGQFVGGVLA